MELYMVLGYAGAVLTGLVLGLMGAGGTLLAVPVLVYLFHVEASVATGYSFFLVSITALTGVVQNVRHRLVDYPVTLYYGIPSVITIFCVRRFVLPALPERIFSFGNYVVDKNHLILLIFSIVMFGAAYKMITAKTDEGTQDKSGSVSYQELALFAVAVGLILGFVGVGGGFLIIPALIHFAKLPMRKAVGTSLVLVAVNCIIGFVGDLIQPHRIDWPFLLTFTAFSVVGILFGLYLSRFIQSHKLKKSFGWFILLIGVYIIVRESFFK